MSDTAIPPMPTLNRKDVAIIASEVVALSWAVECLNRAESVGSGVNYVWSYVANHRTAICKPYYILWKTAVGSTEASLDCKARFETMLKLIAEKVEADQR